MKQLRNIVTGMLILIGGMLPVMVSAQEPVEGDTATALQQEIIVGKDTINQEANQVDVKGIVFGHIGDSYEWHITNIGKTSICIPLPIIVYSETSGWHAFLSSRLEENDGKYEGFYIAPAGSRCARRIHRPAAHQGVPPRTRRREPDRDHRPGFRPRHESGLVRHGRLPRGQYPVRRRRLRRSRSAPRSRWTADGRIDAHKSQYGRHIRQEYP